MLIAPNDKAVNSEVGGRRKMEQEEQKGVSEVDHSLVQPPFCSTFAPSMRWYTVNNDARDQPWLKATLQGDFQPPHAFSKKPPVAHFPNW